MSAYNLPPTYHKIQKHAVFPELTHDEHARYNFLANLNKHISQVILPANKLAFEKRVEPAFEAENGRKITDRDALKTAIKREPMYQIWSALRRSTMEMRQQAGRSIVTRQAHAASPRVGRKSEGVE